MAILTLITTVMALNPADQAGFATAQQKAREIKEAMEPDEQVKFDEVCEHLIVARNQTLPGRGFNSLTSGVSAPPPTPAPAEPETPAAQPEPAQPAEPAAAKAPPVDNAHVAEGAEQFSGPEGPRTT
jgi:hypothetical protein